MPETLIVSNNADPDSNGCYAVYMERAAAEEWKWRKEWLDADDGLTIKETKLVNDASIKFTLKYTTIQDDTIIFIRYIGIATFHTPPPKLILVLGFICLPIHIID
ncbi:hypothetical protein CHS0354_002722 [Potamilus streckersoni]|uniref:Uncharacterized protein n=1 Tax=Potamilus streckersoni TaxID=2493646 RepID=A0AAE0SKR7_9BIVA|nr:hypothetical protein CHS0354_002722 [Potamilus streckersoni]